MIATNEVGQSVGRDQTFTTLTAARAACANEEARVGFSERLPDCRAYELVTPPVKNTSQFDASEAQALSSTVAADGEAVTLTAYEPQPGAPSAGEEYVATRGAGGWMLEDIVPIASYDGVLCLQNQGVAAYSEQLSKDVMHAVGGSRASEHEHVLDPESCNPEAVRS